MSLFKRSTAIILLLVALCANSVLSHTYLSAVYLDNSLLNEGDCVRPHPRTAFDSPIPLVTSADMTCGWLPEANFAANRKCPISAGSKIGLQWHHNSNSPSDDIIDSTHKGPLIVYLAKSDSGAGNVWFKIYEDGLVDGKWAVERLIANRGRVDITIPADIAPGNYLLRGEVLAHHGSYALNGVQPYVGCVELNIASNGNVNPAGVAFPGYYKNTDPGMLLSIYQGITKYIIPGPAVYKSGSAPSTPAPTVTPTVTPTPTSSPPSASPTTRPTTTPTPTYTPTSTPTSTPAPTVPATVAPTTAPAAGNIKVGLDAGSSAWWLAVKVNGGGENTVKVELSDSGSLKSFVTLEKFDWAFTFNPSAELKAPITLRLTSASGKQVVLNNVFSSFSVNGLIDSGKSYSSSSTNPTVTPTETPTVTPVVTPKPTTTPAPTVTPVATPKPTTTPTTPPSNGNNAKVSVYPSAGEWWFAVTVNGADVAKVEIKDSNAVSYSQATYNAWGYQEVYTYSAQGTPLSLPISVKITTKSGSVQVATVTKISPNAVFEASS